MAPAAAITPPTIEPCTRPWTAAIATPTTTMTQATSAGVLESGTGFPMEQTVAQGGREARYVRASSPRTSVSARASPHRCANAAHARAGNRRGRGTCPRRRSRPRASPSAPWCRGFRRPRATPEPSPPSDHPGSRSSDAAGGIRSTDSRFGNNAATDPDQDERPTTVEQLRLARVRELPEDRPSMPRVLLTGFCAVPGPRRAGVQLRHVIRALTPLHSVDLLVVREGDQAYVERQGSVRVLRVPTHEADLRSQVQAFQRALKRQLDGADYDVVHCRDSWSGIPDLDARYARDEETCLLGADLVLAPTPASVRALHSRGKPGRVVLSPLGVDVD